MSKLTDLVSSIQTNEITKFEEYLHSPYFNKSELAIRFFTYLKENMNSFKLGRYDKKELFDVIYPDEKFNEEKLRKITSNFIKLTQRFLIAREADKDFSNEGFLLLKAYSRRNISKSFESSFKIFTDSDKDTAKDLRYYLYKINIEDENLNHSFHKTNKDLSRSVSEILNNVNYLFIASKLKYTINTLVLSLLIDNSINYDIWLKNEILDFIKQNDEFFKLEHKEIYTYYLLLTCFLEKEIDKNYQKLINFFNDNKSYFKKESLESFYIQMLYYNFWKKAESNSNSEELIRLITEMDETGIFENSELIHQHIFVNVIIEFLQNNNKEFATKFFKKYRSKIAPIYRQMTSDLAEAYIAYYGKKYEKCLGLLMGITYDDFFYYLLTKSLYIQIFFDTKKYKMIEALLDSMRQYLKRNDYIPLYYKNEYEIFLKNTNTLLLLNSRYNITKLNEMKKSLEQDNFMPRREWFLHKLNTIDSFETLRIPNKRSI